MTNLSNYLYKLTFTLYIKFEKVLKTVTQADEVRKLDIMAVDTKEVYSEAIIKKLSAIDNLSPQIKQFMLEYVK